MTRNFRFGKDGRFNVSPFAEFYNITNRANFGNNFDGNLTDLGTTFGKEAGFINPSNTNIPRAFAAEFGFRFSF